MGERRRPLAELDPVAARRLATVRQIDDDPELIHPLDDGDAELREPGVGPLGAAVAQQVAGVVGELDAAGAGIVERLEVADAAFDNRGVLEPKQHPDAVGPLRFGDIRGARDLEQLVGPPFEAPLPRLEIALRHREVAVRQTGMDRGETGLRVAGEDRVRFLPPLVGRQRVEDNRVLQQRVHLRCRQRRRLRGGPFAGRGHAGKHAGLDDEFPTTESHAADLSERRLANSTRSE